MNKLALLTVTLSGLLTGYVINHWSTPEMNERFNSDTRMYINTRFDKSYSIDINAGLELKANGLFEYYVVIPRDIGFSAVGDYTLDDGLLSLNIVDSDPLLDESDNKDPLQLYEKFISRAEMHTTENMLAFRPVNDDRALVVFAERGAFYFKPRK
ncbi:MAG: hypothetical protein QNK26_12215 [Moritella sp.]|uniref:hypothetical protein n=1 Tax=Moritella sp. TaxID=78556 RepID=UPI0029AA6901|nr:hypothetical protein [Moritella sp.]MDX2321344.1 hypothetical protein [Moritella sp.]